MKPKFKRFLSKAYPFILAILFIIVAVTSISYKSPTRDEARHLVRGVMLLETGDFRLNKHHPTLANVLCAIPQLFNPKMNVPDTDSDLWKNADKDGLSEEIVEINGGQKAFVFDVLNLSRMVTIIFIALTGVICYFLIRSDFGSVSASIFLFLYFLSPNMIANSRLVTTDAFIVPIVFIATIILYKYLNTKRKNYLILFILTSFLSLLTKYSAVPVAVLWIAILFAKDFLSQAKSGCNLIKRIARSSVLVGFVVLGWAVMLTCAYGFRFTSMADTNYGDTGRTWAHLGNIEHVTQSIPWLTGPMQNFYQNFKVPFPEYIQGFFENILLHEVYGHDTFLLGQYSKTGWWYYFPVVILLKVPIPVLIGLFALFLFVIIMKIKPIVHVWPKVHKLKPTNQVIFFIIPTLLFILSMKSNVNLGIRHILIVLPFIYLGLGILVPKLISKRRGSKIVLIFLGLWYIYSTVSIYPHYLEYFNEFAGGPKNGYKVMLDSNLTWNQDEFLVDDYIEDQPSSTAVYKNPFEEVEQGLVVIDADWLMGRDTNKREQTAWLREPFLNGEIEPIHRIAYTYFVFEIE